MLLLEFTQITSRLSIVALLYLLINCILPHSQVNLIFSTILATSVIARSDMFKNLTNGFLRSQGVVDKTISISHKNKALLDALFDIECYLGGANSWLDRRRMLFKSMNSYQQSLGNKIQYPDKLNQIEQHFKKNDTVLKNIIDYNLRHHKIDKNEYKVWKSQYAVKSRNSEYFRVVESLCHFARDWSDDNEHKKEIEPLLNFIKNNLSDFNPNKTKIIVPGSGLGRVAHECAKLGFETHSVEFSGLMVAMNEYIYSNDELKDNIYPYLHTNSNHLTFADQIRSVGIKHVEKPLSLSLHCADFTKFESIVKQNEDVVIVTCFFIDTAENLIEYIESINRLCENSKGSNGKRLWINMGPLKYGTAAKIELTQEEIKQLVKIMGWEIIQEESPELLGYLTDKKGLWQGYYNVVKWVAKM